MGPGLAGFLGICNPGSGQATGAGSFKALPDGHQADPVRIGFVAQLATHTRPGAAIDRDAVPVDRVRIINRENLINKTVINRRFVIQAERRKHDLKIFRFGDETKRPGNKAGVFRPQGETDAGIMAGDLEIIQYLCNALQIGESLKTE